MTYDSITEDGRLWAVKYNDCPDNALYMLFEQWNDVTWLTRTMQEREHTLRELAKKEKVRSHLLTNNIVDKDSFDDYMSELI